MSTGINSVPNCYFSESFDSCITIKNKIFAIFYSSVATELQIDNQPYLLIYFFCRHLNDDQPIHGDCVHEQAFKTAE